MQQIYRRTPMPNYDFNKVALQFVHIFRTPFPKNTSGWLLLHLSNFHSLNQWDPLGLFSINLLTVAVTTFAFLQKLATIVFEIASYFAIFSIYVMATNPIFTFQHPYFKQFQRTFNIVNIVCFYNNKRKTYHLIV